MDSTLCDLQRQNLSLQLASSRTQLYQLKSSDSANSAVYYQLHFNAFLRAFVSESDQDYREYRRIKAAALDHYKMLSDTSPYQRFLASDVYFYAGTLMAKRGEYYNSAMAVRKAWNLIEQNHQLFPHFIANNKTRGILKVYLSTVPESYDWVTRLLGFEGNLNQGLRLLKTLTEYRDGNKCMEGVIQETQYMYAYALLHVAKKNAIAWNEMLKCTEDYQSNLLSSYFRSLMALKLNKNEIAFKTLAQRPRSEMYTPFHTLLYHFGIVKLQRGDSSAIHELKQFLQYNNGENFIKSCYQKMSWYYVLEGKMEWANYYKSQIELFGVRVYDEDKQAERYAKKELPHPTILRARLLYDGGYYKRAYDVLNTLSIKDLMGLDQKAEFCYRKGRILEKLGYAERALNMYEACSIFARNSEEYYGAYACIFAGDIYASQQKKELSLKFYKRALTYSNNQEYIDVINYRVEIGLKKVQ